MMMRSLGKIIIAGYKIAGYTIAACSCGDWQFI
jgi:hypothetical protein